MKLSVCMATYNGAEFVVRQLNSVLSQLSENDQVVVVDDGSKDRTVDLIRETYGDRVEVYNNPVNLGVIKSFEKAMSLAQGDIIFLCDQDDEWENNKVEKVMTAFEQSDASVVVHDASVVDGKGEIIHTSWNSYNGNVINQGILGNIVKNAFTGCMMAFKKELIPYFSPFPQSIEMHDQWIALVAKMRKEKIVYIDEPLMKYYRHGGNVTGMKKRSLSAQVKGRAGTLAALMKYKR
jgi:glycosyltransferase involved in cell wall biosynthesis